MWFAAGEVLEPSADGAFGTDEDLPAVLEPEDVGGGGAHGGFEGAHAVGGVRRGVHGEEGGFPFAGGGGGDGEGEDGGFRASGEEGGEGAGAGGAAEEGDGFAFSADALVGEDADGGAFAEEAGDVERVVAFGEHACSVVLAAFEDLAVHDGVVEGAVERAGFGAWGEEVDDAAEDFPVAHVGEEDYDAGLFGEGVFEEVGVFEGEDFAELFRGESGGVGGGEEVGGGAFEGGACNSRSWSMSISPA